MVKVIKYLRLDEWISSKVAMLLGALAYFICLGNPGITAALMQLGIYFVFLFALSAVCYILNDLFDIEVDKKAGKKKVIAKIPKWAVWLTVIIIAAGGNVPIFLYVQNKILCAVIVFVNYAFGVSYSLPGLRFKERGIPGLIECSLAQRCVPLSVFFLFRTFGALDWVLWSGWFVLSFMNGLRYILIHQYIDRRSDKMSGVHTFVSDRQIGIRKAIVALFALECVFAAGLLVPVAMRYPVIISVGVAVWLILEFCTYQVLNVFAKKDWMVTFDSVPLEALLNVIMPVMFGICMMTMSAWAITFSAFILLCCLRTLWVKLKLVGIYVKSKVNTVRERRKGVVKISVYCEKQNKEDIERLVRETLKADGAVFLGYENLLHRGGKLVVDHELVHTLKGDELDGYVGVYVFFKGRIYDVSSAEALLAERQSLLDENNYCAAKDVDEVLRDVDFLKKNRECLSYPDFFQIESTDYCNSRCIMCEHYFRHNKNCDTLSMETLDNLSDVVMLGRIINLNGMGEPFISKHIIEQIDKYVAYGNRLVANTNLSVLTDELIDRIRDNFECLAISIDGARKETYEAIRIGLKFDTVIDNLYLLKEKAPDLKKIICMVTMRQNVCEMPEIVELAHDAGVGQVTFLTLTPNFTIGNFGDAMSNYPKVLEYYSVKALEVGEKYGMRVVVANEGKLNRNITYEEIEDELNAMNAAKKWKTAEEVEAMERIGGKVDDFLQKNDARQSGTVPSNVKCKGVCDWLLKNCYMNLKGDVYMCCRNSLYQAGNVNEAGFLPVWNSPLMREARDIFYSGYVPEACLKCGMIECGELKYLKADVTDDFYKDSELKELQKKKFAELVGE
ncbi:MAG: UbiA family prenyltransferase [Clostridiales bacterium]|nr:UbiA family prenyltransferase [Clostridiales bacterium]